MSKKTKLKKIHLTSVDMVHRGANQEAFINLYKSEGGAPNPNPPPDASEGANTGELPQGLLKSIADLLKGFLGTGESQDGIQDDAGEAGAVEKAAETFDNKVATADLREQRWKYEDALRCSIESILNDIELSDDEKVRMMDESVEQFAAAYKKMCAQLVKATADTRVTSNQPMEVGKSQGEEETPDNQEEGEREMKIDKSRFTAEELAQYEALIAKGQVDEEPEDGKKPTEGEKDVEKSMHPEVKKALDEMAELRKSMEMKEMSEVAKKYAPLGKKEDELAQTLYDMKKSSPESYDAYIAVLDENLDLVNKSGLFTEIGKSGRGTAGGSTEDKIESIATELQKSDSSLNRVQAIAKAWEQHPELVAEYDSAYQGGR